LDEVVVRNPELAGFFFDTALGCEGLSELLPLVAAESLRVVTLPAGVSFPGVPHLEHLDVGAVHVEDDGLEHREGVVLDVGDSVGACEHKIFFFAPELDVLPEGETRGVVNCVAFVAERDVLDGVVGHVFHGPPVVAALNGTVGADELSPGLLHKHGPDLTVVHGLSVDGALFRNPDAVHLY